MPLCPQCTVDELDTLNNKFACVSLDDNSASEWMLDSGASMHFTFDIEDFVDYQAIAPIPVKTATTVTSITGI